ncbi:MAG TPA: O-antigen ligase family protein [Cyclobacteriaceae bacterium]|nr:O-antigen ligase family protein [Cyclobacteriaceae bacterium]
MSKLSYNNIYFSSWLVCIVTLPWIIQWNSAAIILLGIVSLTEGNYSQKWQRLKSATWIIPFMIFFALHVLGVLYSTDKDLASFEVEKKLSFLVLPIIAASGPAPDAVMWRNLCRGFVLSCLALVVLSFYFSWIGMRSGGPHNFDVRTLDHYRQLNPGSSSLWEYFSYIQLVDWIDIHPAYFSMYLIFGCALLLEDMRVDSQIKVVNTVLTMIFIFFIALLSSRIAIVSLVVILIYLLRDSVKTKATKVFVGAACISGLFILILINPVSRYRIFQEPLLTPVEIASTTNDWNSVNLRLLEWRASVAGISTAWLFGLGPGDGQAYLNGYYSNFNDATAGLTYNSHNQYLQTTLELGVVGLLVLGICLFKPLLFPINPNPLFIAFIILFGLMCLTESMLARQKGIVFFTMFESLFLRIHFQK